MDAKTKHGARVRRHARVRKKVSGSAERPRLAVFRSNRHIYAQLIDDNRRVTLASASSLKLTATPKEGESNKVASAREVGRAIAAAAQAQGIKTVVFDRGGFLFHGRVKALAEAARQAGLEF